MSTFKELIRKEKHVALTAQPPLFRLIKWFVILLVTALLVIWKGWITAIAVFASFGLIGICLHFLLRWKTKGWTESWGPYKKISLE